MMNLSSFIPFNKSEFAHLAGYLSVVALVMQFF